MFVFHDTPNDRHEPLLACPPFFESRVHLLCSIGGVSGQGTHLVGGDFNYVHLGEDQYEITLKVYRDCSPANTNETYFDDNVAIGLWDGTGTIEFGDVILIPLLAANVSEVPWKWATPVERLRRTCALSRPFTRLWSPCLRMHTAGIWCTNDAVATPPLSTWTILEVENAGMTLQVHIPGTDITTESNSSPEFQELPPVAMCTDLPFVWDHAALDPDGDDLVYSLCPPKQGGDAANAIPTLLPRRLTSMSPTSQVFRGTTP